MKDKILMHVPMLKLRPSRFQPRTSFDPATLLELAQSIDAEGIIDEPIVFVPDDQEKGDTIYELIAGERRVRAAIAVAWAQLDDHVDLEDAVACLAEDGFHPLPDRAETWLRSGNIALLCRVQHNPDGLTLEQVRRMVVVEGLQRANLSPIEEARAIQSLLEAESLSQRDLAAQIGKSQGWVQQRLSLLGMPATVQEAVASERISATHARAIAAAPAPLQETLAKRVTQADAAGEPVSTREIEDASRELTRFIDPDRWLPNAEAVYRPLERNHLALIRWALQRADLAAVADRLLEMRALADYHGGNLLSKQARSVANSGTAVTSVVQALGFAHAEAAWNQFAADDGRTCEYCVFGEHPSPGKSRLMYDSHCQRWLDKELTTCRNYIGAGDPVIIPVEDYWRRSEFEKAGLELVGQPFVHMQSVPDYVKAYQLAETAQAERKTEQERKQRLGYVDEIERFVAWQFDMAQTVLHHPQAHACCKCIHSKAAGEDCRFLDDPLVTPYDKDVPRAPAFGALVSPDGRLFPRCEMFVFESMPTINQVPGWRIGDRDQLLAWLRRIIKLGALRSTSVLFGYLSWIPYGRGKDGNDYSALIKWIGDHWDDLGGDEAIPTLIDVVAAETTAMHVQSCSTITLLNPSTGKHESWVPVSFAMATGREEISEWRLKEWPPEFPRPWEAETDPEPAPEPSLSDAMREAEINAEWHQIEEEEAYRAGPRRRWISHEDMADDLQIPVATVRIVRELVLDETTIAGDCRRRYPDDQVAAARLLAHLRHADQRALDAIDEEVVAAIREADADRIPVAECE